MASGERFEGIKAVVTGGGSGIGYAVAARIIAEGGEVMLWDIDQQRLDAATAKLGGRARRGGSTSPTPTTSSARRTPPTPPWAGSTPSSAAPASRGRPRP